MIVLTGIDKVNAQNAKCFLLEQSVVFQQFDMQDDHVWFPAGMKLETDTHPPVGIIGFGVVQNFYSVGKSKETGIRLFITKQFAKVPVFGF